MSTISEYHKELIDKLRKISSDDGPAVDSTVKQIADEIEAAFHAIQAIRLDTAQVKV